MTYVYTVLMAGAQAPLRYGHATKTHAVHKRHYDIPRNSPEIKSRVARIASIFSPLYRVSMPLIMIYVSTLPFNPATILDGHPLLAAAFLAHASIYE